MIRLPAFILVGCVVCAGLIPIEFGSVSSHRPLPEARLPAAEVEPAAPEIRKLAKETPSSANDDDSPLRDVRLTGVVIGPDLRMAMAGQCGSGRNRSHHPRPAPKRQRPGEATYSLRGKSNSNHPNSIRRFPLGSQLG